MKEKNKLAEIQISDLVPIVLTVVIIAIGAVFGLDALDDVNDTFGTDACLARSDASTVYNAELNVCQNSTGGAQVSPDTFQTNATQDGLSGASKFPERLPLIATVLVAALLIGILVTFLVVRIRR